MSKDTVFTIAEELERVDALLTESMGELTPEIEELLEAIEGKTYDKARKIGNYILELNAMELVAKAEKKRVSDILSVRANKVKRMKNWLLFLLDRAGLDKVEHATVTCTVRDNSSPSISWTEDMEEIPEAFRVITYSYDSAKVKAYLKQHGKLPEGFKVERGQHVQVK